MKIKKFSIITTIIITLIVLVFNKHYVSFAADNENLITKDFKITYYSRISNEITYGVSIIKEGENTETTLTFDASDYHLPSNLYNYRDDIRLRITYSPEDFEIYDCKIVDLITNKILEDISEENIEKLYNIEYKANITDKEWTDKIKLSELKQNQVYKFTANEKTNFPKIENDIGENCIIYLKEKDEESYEKKINMFKNFSSSSLSFSLNEYNSGESFNFMYRKIENSELLRRVSQDDIIFLSKFKDGDKLEYKFEKYIYNDTETDINVDIKNIVFGVEKTDSILVEKGKIYGFDWMINSATIRYSKDVDNKENDDKENETTEEKNNNNSNNNSNNNQNKDNNNSNNNLTNNQNKDNNSSNNSNNNEKNNNSNQATMQQKDNTVATKVLPKTGTINFIFATILLFCIIIAIIAKKLNNFKDIK